MTITQAGTAVALYLFAAGMGGFVGGPLADRFGPRIVLVVGAVMLGVGLLATSAVDSIWVGYFTYGLGVGTAVACAYVPMVATVGAWHRTLDEQQAARGVDANDF